MRRKITIAILFIFLQCVFFAGCGSVSESKPSQSKVLTDAWGVVMTPEPIIAEVSRTEEELAEVKASKEAVVTVGVTVSGDEEVYHAVNSFNNSQDKYWAEVKVYSELSQLLVELTSDKGADIYYIDDINYTALAQNGMFEELTPYLERSEVISKEDIVASAWRAGCVEEKFYFVIPRFTPAVMLVEKGYTDNGVWNMEEYLALAEKYPEGMLSQWVTDPEMLVLNDLVMSLDSYVNWEALTCSFDGESFINLLEGLKGYQEKKYESFTDYNIAEQLQQKMRLTESTLLNWDSCLFAYKDVRDTLLEFCEIVGMPNEDGVLKYRMVYEEFYGMSAVSKNKEAAWCFLEHTLSEEYLTLLHNEGRPWNGMYPSNRNVLEKFLDEEVGNDHGGRYFHTNKYTYEKVNITEFTEEDKQILLNILENCYVARWIVTMEPFEILTEELDYYFQGGKSAEEVAKVIQSRMSLYLMECQ